MFVLESKSFTYLRKIIYFGTVSVKLHNNIYRS